MQPTSHKAKGTRGHLIRVSDRAWERLQVVAQANYFKSRTELLNSLNSTDFQFDFQLQSSYNGQVRINDCND